MEASAWWSSFERYRIIDALHEAGHAIAAKLLGAVDVRLHLDQENFEVRGSVDFDLDPTSEEPDGGWEVDFRGTAADALVPLSRGSDVPTRLWVVTRAGGVGAVVGCRALGFEVEVDDVMADCEHDDESLGRLLRSAPAAMAQRWVDLRYRETWALLLGHAGAVLAIARHAVGGDGQSVEVELGRAANGVDSTSPLDSDDDLSEAQQVASGMGFGSWPDWREHKQRRFEAFKALHS